MPRSDHARRLAILEHTITPAIPPEVHVYAEELAAADGHIYTAGELIDEVQSTLRAIGPPYTIDRMVRYMAHRDGIPEAELRAALEGYTHDDL